MSSDAGGVSAAKAAAEGVADDASIRGGVHAGTLYIVSAPSGAGKTTLTKGLLAAEPSIAFSISTTTRALRPGEREGVDYHYVSIEEFERLVAADAFLEHAFVHGNYYGTRRDTVANALSRGSDILLDIDVQGAAQVREARSKAANAGLPFFRTVSVFIMPPSIAILERRLRDRGTNTEEDMRRRIERATAEMQRMREYDHVIVNDDAEAATARLIALYRAEREKALRQPQGTPGP